MQDSPEELEYNWFEAAKSYEQAVSSRAETGAIRAEYWQRIGYCYGLASRQAENVQEFKRLRQLAVNAYQKSAQIYEHENRREDQGMSFLCLALAEYNRSWLASSHLDKIKALENCWKLGKKALRVFKSAGDELNCGKTCNTLVLCISDLHSVTPTSEAKRRVLQEGLDNASIAISVFSRLEKKDDLILALCMSSIISTYLKDVSDRGNWKSLSNNSLKQSKAAVELSQQTENAYSKAMSKWAETASTLDFEEKIEKRFALEYPKEMLRQSSIIRDNYFKGIAYQLLANTVYSDIHEEADPDKRKQKYKDMITYSENAIQNLQIVCQDAEIALAYMYYSESCCILAREFATTVSKKRTMFKKAIETGEKGIEYAIRSGAPWALWCSLHALSRAYHYYSTLEPRKEKRVKLLNDALKYRKEEIKLTIKAFGSNVWFTGIGMVCAAQIEAELAILEKNQGRKAGFFKDAVTDMERGVSQLKKQLEFFTVPPVMTSIAESEAILGRMLEENYSFNREKENLMKANETYDNAARNFTKVNMPSRAAECYWKIAKNQDLFGEYRKAAENFQKASAEYKLTAKKIIQFKDFYLDYSTYMKAWSEIENAKLAHNNEEFDVAEKHYERTAHLLKQSKSWAYLSSNFHSWSLLEQAENLSRKDNCKESIDAFGKTIKSFQQSKRFLIAIMDGMVHADEKDMTKKLIEVSNAREEYSQGRIAIEEAKILDTQGDHTASSEKYQTAATFFKNLLRVNSEQIGYEAKPLFYLCQAWQKMTLAEARSSPIMYEEAADLFTLANEYSTKESTSLLALGHSSFCKALEAGTEFEITRDMTKYTEANKYMNVAANYYLKAGFEAFSEYATATQRLFDAYVFTDKAKREIDPEKQARYYLMAEKVLQISAEYYAKVKYYEKSNQVQRLLRKVKEDKDLAVSLNEVFHAPIITSSTASFATLSLSEEKAVGLDRLAQTDVLAQLIMHENVPKVGQDISLEIQIANIGKEPVLLTKIEDIVPMGFQLRSKPDYCSFENSNLTFEGKQLNPMKIEEIEIVLRPFKKGSRQIKPRVIYVNETGRQLSCNPETLELTISETVLQDRVTTGYSDLDDLLFGGIPENCSVVLTSPSSDERQLLVDKFVEAGVKSGQTTFYITTSIEGVKALAEEYQSNFYVFICNPRADVIIKALPNVFKFDGVENLTNIDISLTKVLRALDASLSGPKRACIDIVSDVLLQHHAVVTRKWLSSLLPELRAKGFITLAVVNPQMHPKEEVQAITGQFEGEIQIYEKETEKGPRQFLRIRKLYNQQYLEAELLLQKI